MKPVIYQLFPRTFTNYNPNCVPNGTIEQNGCGKFNLLTEAVLEKIVGLGVTHVWYTGVIRHATSRLNHPLITKGHAGSPFSVTDFYDVDPDLATETESRMSEFESLIERTHNAGLKVCMDYIPNQVSREYHSVCKPDYIHDIGEDDTPEWAFSPLNDFYYLPGEKFEPTFPIGDYNEFPAKVTGNDCFTAHPTENDWYETVKLNYGVHYINNGEKQFNPIPPLWYKMLDVLRFWAGKKVDMFRMDMVEMVPIEFWSWLLPQVKKEFPGVEFLAESYQPNNYRALLDAGFDYLYDKVGMYDCLRDIVSRSRVAKDITSCWMRWDESGIKNHLLYFLENHDEQRIGSGFFCGNGTYAKPAVIVLATLWQNPILIYAGQELGEKGMNMEGFSGMDGRTSIYDYCTIPSILNWANNGAFDEQNLTDEQKKLQLFYTRLLNIAKDNPAITEGKLFDLEYCQHPPFNDHRQFAFLRQYDDEILLVVVNFDDKKVNIPIVVPQDAFRYLSLDRYDLGSGTDLLTGQEYADITVQPDQPFNLTLKAWDGVILKLHATAR